ncbi:MAG: HD-GYP domain-containing protein [Hydrogenovibrio sp.]|uniref:HD-GYP domain-containing protein n=1 Tax=Hydrogenovibrio sp. TaxID=2065821 RepID=UPI0028704827|nr:HD-GYP domain-containing protein [Hydrogenovibrio sp.]MDR9497894.1 HD-GYP domain-containing protein [Hydrogenovibrio sp.]
MMPLLFKIIERPAFAALLVGTLINLATWTALWGLTTQEQFSAKWHHLSDYPLYFWVTFLIPYLVPFVMMSLSRRLTRQRMRQLMRQFPEMNPDMVMRLKPDLSLEYLNPAGHQLLQHLALLEQTPKSWLPDAILARLEQATAKPVEADADFDGTCLHFRAKRGKEGDFFISARDVTEQRFLQSQLNQALLQLNDLTEFQETALKEYDPLTFDLFVSIGQMLNQLTLADPQQREQLPDYIFCTVDKPDQQRVLGQIYRLSQTGVTHQASSFELSEEGKSYAISKGEEGEYTQNWEPESQSLKQFQTQFNPRVREVVGDIYGYTTYRSGNTSVIGFFKHNRVRTTASHVLKNIAIIAQALHRISLESREIYAQFKYTLDALARASEANDEDTGDHILRLNEYSYLLAKAMGQDQAFCDELRNVAMMHDVGKIHLDPHVLKKPGRLNHQEMNHIKEHPVYGGKILGDAPLMQMARDIAYYHHERYDGSGYPFGLKGEDIPLAARIVSVADVYDALRQQRVYKPSFSHEKTFEILTKGDDRTQPKHFDPKVLAAFKQVHQDMNHVFEQMQ